MNQFDIDALRRNGWEHEGDDWFHPTLLFGDYPVVHTFGEACAALDRMTHPAGISAMEAYNKYVASKGKQSV